MTYEFEIRIDLGKAVPAIGELLDSMNDTLTKCGQDGKLKCLTSFGSIDVTANRELTKEELDKMKKVLSEHLQKSELNKYGITVVQYRCKSVNPSCQSS